MEFARDGRLAVGLKTEVILCSVDVTEGTLTPLQALSTNYQKAISLAWTPDGEHLASVGEYWDWSIVRLWKFRSHTQSEMRLEAEISQDVLCTQAKFSPDGQLLAVARKDGMVRIMRDEKSEKGWITAADIGTAGPAGSAIPTSVASSSDGQSIAVGGKVAIKIWTLTKKEGGRYSVTNAGDGTPSLKSEVQNPPD